MFVRSLPRNLSWESFLGRSQRTRIPIKPQFPVTETCPLPTCDCRPMPDGLKIDHSRPLNGTMVGYSEQVLISTGMRDWERRIEEDGRAEFLHELKHLLGRGGKFSDPFHNVMITNSSFATGPDPAFASAYLFPSFQYVQDIPITKPSVEEFVKAFVLPQTPNNAHEALTRAQRDILRRNLSLQSNFPNVRPVDEIVILICGHGTRDERCGILGPLLQLEFEDQLRHHGIKLLKEGETARDSSDGPRAHIGLISHIGGHKFAGNVIIYLPPSLRDNPLSGKGIWYGRVGTSHVEGIVKSTILGGKVIQDMFRGGVEQGGGIMRL